jgi:hypothetical protein
MLSRNLTKLGWLGKANSQTNLSSLGGVIPSLDLNFANNKSLLDNISGNNLVTFTRASSGTYVGDDGLIKTATTNEPRFDHDFITGESLGLLIEEQRTNFIRNNTMAGVATGTPGTLPTNWGYTGAGIGTLNTEIVNTGTVNGINYVDIKISGTTSTTSLNVRFENPADITTTVGQNWNCSAYLSIIGGSTSNITGLGLGLIERSNVGGFLTTSRTEIVSTINSTLTRYSHTRTTTNALTAQIEPNLQLAFSSGVNIDITIRIGLPQIENELFPTSVIITTGTATTRSADVASITGTNFSSWYNQSEGALYTQSKKNYIGASSFPRIFQISDTTNNNSISNIWLEPSNTLGLVVRDSANLQAEIGSPGLTQNIEHKSGMCYKLNDIAISNNGNAVTTDTSAIIPTVDRMFIGKDDGNLYLNGTIKRISYFPTRLSNAILENITK